MKIAIIILALLGSSIAAAQSKKTAQGQAAPFVWSTASSSFSWPPVAPSVLEIFNGEKLVVSIGINGKVTFGKGMTQDKASREFWRILGKQYLMSCRAADGGKE